MGTERNNRKELQRVRGRGEKREERKALGSQSEGSRGIHFRSYFNNKIHGTKMGETRHVELWETQGERQKKGFLTRLVLSLISYVSVCIFTSKRITEKMN